MGCPDAQHRRHGDQGYFYGGPKTVSEQMDGVLAVESRGSHKFVQDLVLLSFARFQISGSDGF